VEGEPEFYADGLLVHNSYRYRSIWDEVLQPALRKGDPRVIVTTTPSASPLLKEWYQRWLEHAKRGETCDIHLTAAIFKENDTLPPRRVEELERQYGGTRIGRQELEGEMLEDFEGAMWRREFIEAHRVRESDFFHSSGKLKTELFERIVVAVDPSMTSGERADESGIVIAGQGVDKDAYIIADWSVNGTPEAVMSRAVAAYYEFYADCVVMEANQGGDYLTKALRTADPNVPPRIVRASKGKMIRAQPVSMLAEQGRLHHIGVFQKLEDELCVVAGTLVTTSKGDIPIEDVQVGDLAFTRQGWRPVTQARCTGVRGTVRVETSSGELRCTPDHLVHTAEQGWVEAGSLRPGDKLMTCRESSDLTLSSTARSISLTTPAITRPVVLAGTSSCTVMFGRTPTAPSRRDGTSTIRTTTRATTGLATSSPSPPANMFWRTEPEAHGGYREIRWGNSRGTYGENVKKLGLFPRGDLARSAGKKYSPSAPTLRSTVVENVRSGLRIAEPVYDLTIDGAHEFFANGILVHNCMMTPEQDRLRHDDRADAMIWAVSELRGITDGSYMEAYGFTYCNSCGEAFRKAYKKCPKCGHEIDPALESASLRPGSWAAAYMNTCKTCGSNYSVREKECPQCHPTPKSYMAGVHKWAGHGNWLQIPQRNPLQGRRF
jgi:phage terminase large subunit-like protein